MNFRAVLPALTAVLVMAGCASTGDCSGDWYGHGWSDGRYGTFAQADLYARHCPGIDADAYNRGWRDGSAARPTVGGL